VLLLVVLAVFVRLRLLSVPLERDEGEFAYAGQLMLQGVPPYTLACNIKLPGIYAAYAAMMAVFGQTAVGIHFGFLLVNLATLPLLFYLARRLLPWPGELVCCAAYVLLTISPRMVCLAGHAAHFVVLAALGGLLVLLRAREKDSGRGMFLSGLLFGVAFLCKQPGLFFGFLGFVILSRDVMLGKPAAWRLRLRNLALFSLGGILPLGLTCLIMWRAGSFDQFWFWTITYAQVHGQMLPQFMGTRHLAEFFSAGPERWFFLAGAAGLVCLWLKPDANDRRLLLTAWYFLSWCAVTVGFYFTRHYFIFLLPVTCLLLGTLVTTLSDWLSRARMAGLSFVAPGLFMAALGWLVWANRAVWFEMSPNLVSALLYAADPFVECVTVAQYIRENSSPSDRIAVIGSEPEVYFYAQRRSVSGYLYMYDLMGDQPYASKMQREFIHDVEAAKPEYLVLVNDPSSWTTWPQSDRTIFVWSRQYPPKFYQLAGIVAIYPSYSEYFWGKEAASAEVKTSTSIYVLKRKPN
jgi:Dolichyl-phosphate-mannose-protein mannosyltransferase